MFFKCQYKSKRFLGCHSFAGAFSAMNWLNGNKSIHLFCNGLLDVNSADRFLLRCYNVHRLARHTPLRGVERALPCMPKWSCSYDVCHCCVGHSASLWSGLDKLWSTFPGSSLSNCVALCAFTRRVPQLCKHARRHCTRLELCISGRIRSRAAQEILSGFTSWIYNEITVCKLWDFHFI